ncbi:hypothetical protein RYX36_026955, partial [Vicia faba]
SLLLRYDLPSSSYRSYSCFIPIRCYDVPYSNSGDSRRSIALFTNLLPVLIDGDRHEGQSFRLSEFPSTMPEMFSDALRSGVEVAYHKE